MIFYRVFRDLQHGRACLTRRSVSEETRPTRTITKSVLQEPLQGNLRRQEKTVLDFDRAVDWNAKRSSLKDGSERPSQIVDNLDDGVLSLPLSFLEFSLNFYSMFL